MKTIMLIGLVILTIALVPAPAAAFDHCGIPQDPISGTLECKARVEAIAERTAHEIERGLECIEWGSC